MGGITIAANEDDVASCSSAGKRLKQELDEDSIDVGIASSTSSGCTDSTNQILSQETYVPGATRVQQSQQQQQKQQQQQLQHDNDSENEALIVDGDSPTGLSQNESMSEYNLKFIIYLCREFKISPENINQLKLILIRKTYDQF